MELLLTGAFKYSKEQLNKIENLGYRIKFVQDERIALDFDVSSIDVVVCNSLFLYNDIRAFSSLKVIQLVSSGLDRIPLNYISDNGIKVLNARGVYSIPMAEWVILKILEIYKKTILFYKNQERHRWEKHRDLWELTDKTASIIGYGDVGNEVAKRLKAFGVNIIGVGRREIQSDYVDESMLISELDISDIVILTLPLNDKTKHLINKNRLDIMKNNAVLINVARGGIIDETALLEILSKGKFLGVALDVFNEEPLDESNPLWSLPSVIITPHNSFVSDKVNERMFMLIFENLSKVIN